MTSPRDPRLRRAGFTPPVDARAAAGRLEAAADAMRAQQLERGNVEEPPTGLLDLAAIRAALGAEPGGEVNPAAVRWLAGHDEPEVLVGSRGCPWCAGTPSACDTSCTCPGCTEPDQPFEHSAEPEPVHPHPYFVEGCADCVARAEEDEALEDQRRIPPPTPLPEVVANAERTMAEVRRLEETLPVPVEPPAPVAPMPPVDGAPAPAPYPHDSLGRPIEDGVNGWIDPEPVPAFISEQPGERVRAWRSRHDERSRAFGVRRGLAASAPLTDHLWPVGPVLDQGAEGACVGFGVIDAYNVREMAWPDGRDTANADLLDGAGATQIYKRAQQLDDVPGESYTGTSVLAGMQAGVEAGLFGGYLWAFGTKDVAQAVLQRGPVVVGIPWPESWFDAPADGLLTLDAHDTGDQGHCLAVVGLLLHGPRGDLGPYFVLQNSYGPAWGHGGFGYVHHRDLARLLRDRGEAAIPTREALQ